ncbi:bifunctional MaoC family dehydratase N-terminal/OB-fold nucleic acid binding domain-containing protein [Streptomyces sp. NPDC020965]|uniref:bifunctional MaoC family dehydratase N-terminal/OB-fold nucleic acid binding domain-containing protein n=1 Tax=Streptomyces sp. NPDC020965 TaxID=3365105 RepID=UPI0037AE4A96
MAATSAVGVAGADSAVGPPGSAASVEPADDVLRRLKEYEGRATAVDAVGKDLVNEPMIRHWCEAMGDTNPAYRGADAMAPPAMLQAWTMGGLSGHTHGTSAQEELFALLDGCGYTSVVATDCEQEYLRPLRPGDRVTFDAVIESVSDRKTTKLGTGHFVTTRMDLRANGELAGTHRFRILKYAPPVGSARPAPAPAPAAPAPASAAGRSGDGGSGDGGSGAGTGEGEGAPRLMRPRPVINRDNAGFWAGIAEHRLLIQRCEGCGELRFPWLPGCNACGSAEWDTITASGAGTVYSYVVMHHPRFPAFDPPYAVGLIELAEGVRIVSDVIGAPYDEVRIGAPVELEFLRVDEELEVPAFRVSPSPPSEPSPLSASSRSSPSFPPSPSSPHSPPSAREARSRPATSADSPPSGGGEG